jgi:hypothetical protein
MKKIFEIIIGIAAVLIFIVAINSISNSGPTGAAINPTITATPLQGIGIIQARLKQLGVPIQEIKSVASPNNIEIIVQMLKGETNTSPDDQWNLFLASREATLAYLHGFRVSSFSLSFAKTNGEIVETGTTFLYPNQFSQQLTEVKSAGIDDAAAKGLIEKNLTLNKLKIVSLQINSDEIVRANTKFVDLVLESPSGRTTTDINFDINSLINHLTRMVKDLEAKSHPNISLVRIRINDDKGNFLLHYIYDFDTYAESWSLANGLEGSWYSKPQLPVFPQASPSATLTPVPTLPGGGYPPPNSTVTPTPTLTPHAYP